MFTDNPEASLNQLRLPEESTEAACRRISFAHLREHVWRDAFKHSFPVELKLFAIHYGHRFDAVVKMKGPRFQGREYRTFRQAATAALKSVGKAGVQTPSGQIFWKVDLGNGHTCSVADYLKSR